MTPQALNLAASDISSVFQFIIYSPEQGLISEHIVEEDARSSFECYLCEFEMGNALPWILKRQGEQDWDFLEN